MIQPMIPFNRLNYTLAGFHTAAAPLFCARHNSRSLLALLFDYAAELQLPLLAWSLEPGRLQLTLQTNRLSSGSGLLKRCAAQFLLDAGRTALFPGLNFFERKLTCEEALVSSCRYVHCSPAVNGRCHTPSAWAYSNMLEFTRKDFWRMQPPHLQRLFHNGDGYAASLQRHMEDPACYPVNVRFERILLPCQTPQRPLPAAATRSRPRVAEKTVRPDDSYSTR